MTLSSVSSVFVSRSSGWCPTATHIGFVILVAVFSWFCPILSGECSTVAWHWLGSNPSQNIPTMRKRKNTVFVWQCQGRISLFASRLPYCTWEGILRPPLIWIIFSPVGTLKVFGRETTSVRSFAREKNIAVRRLWFKSDWNAHVTSAVWLCELFAPTENLKFHRCHLRNVT